MILFNYFHLNSPILFGSSFCFILFYFKEIGSDKVEINNKTLQNNFTTDASTNLSDHNNSSQRVIESSTILSSYGDFIGPIQPQSHRPQRPQYDPKYQPTYRYKNSPVHQQYPPGNHQYPHYRIQFQQRPLNFYKPNNFQVNSNPIDHLANTGKQFVGELFNGMSQAFINLLSQSRSRPSSNKITLVNILMLISAKNHT